MKREAIELLVQNMTRLNEENSDDRQGVFYSLGVIESIVTLSPDISNIIVSKTTLMPFLLNRIKVKTAHSNLSNREYSSELLSILCNYSRENRLALNSLDGIDDLLQVVASYKKKDPIESDETEMMVNCFDTLCCVLQEPECKQKFISGEGIELLLIMLK